MHLSQADELREKPGASVACGAQQTQSPAQSGPEDSCAHGDTDMTDVQPPHVDASKQTSMGLVNEEEMTSSAMISLTSHLQQM